MERYKLDPQNQADYEMRMANIERWKYEALSLIHIYLTRRFSDKVIEKYRTQSDPILYPDVNWTDLLVSDASYQTQTNINISGGTERVKYFFSAGYFTQDGLFNTDVYDPGYDCLLYTSRCV